MRRGCTPRLWRRFSDKHENKQTICRLLLQGCTSRRICAYIQVRAAREEERRKAEAERVEAVQMHCGILEEQHKKSLESMRSEMQREKSKAHALQRELVELQKVRNNTVRLR